MNIYRRGYARRIWKSSLAETKGNCISTSDTKWEVYFTCKSYQQSCHLLKSQKWSILLTKIQLLNVVILRLFDEYVTTNISFQLITQTLNVTHELWDVRQEWAFSNFFKIINLRYKVADTYTQIFHMLVPSPKCQEPGTRSRSPVWAARTPSPEPSLLFSRCLLAGS